MLEEICPLRNEKTSKADIKSICKSKSPASDFACWATLHPNVRKCADAVTIHAVNQCVALAGFQNSLAAKVAQWLFPIQSVAGLGADIAAITSAASKNNPATAALTAAVLSNSAAIQKTATGSTAVKVSDLASTEQSFLLLSDFEDKDIPKGYQAHPETILKYSELHDAVLATCPANNP